jgi:predicted NBD/HSP70 family sugar kinase
MHIKEKTILENRKFYQRNKVLDILRYQTEVSRYDIKKATLYSMTTVLSLVDELIHEEYIFEKDCAENRVGRKPTWLYLNPEAGYFIGLEFNGQSLHCNVLDFIGKVVHASSMDMDFSDDKVIIMDKITSSIQVAISFLKTISENVRIFGIGIGIPGYVNRGNGDGIEYSYFKDLKDVAIKSIIEKKFKYPCFVDNNVNVMAMAYKNLLLENHNEDFVFLSIRTGARIVPVINNRMVFSNFGISGEVGHIKIASKHNICTCGHFGCLNTEISEFAIISKIREGIAVGRFQEIYELANNDLSAISMKLFIISAKNKDCDSLILMEEIAEYLSVALGIILNILAPKKIIVFSELINLGKPFFDIIYKNLKNEVISENLNGFELIPSAMGKDIGAIGAATVVMSECFGFIEQTV